MMALPAPFEVPLVTSNLIPEMGHQPDKGGNPEGAFPDASLLRGMVDGSEDAIVLVDSDGTVQFVNQAATHLFCRPRKELEGGPFGFPLAQGHTEIDILPANSDPLVAEMQVSAIPWGKRIGYLAILRDITERKEMERELRLSGRVFEHATDGLAVADAEKGILKVNPAFSRITGLYHESVQGTSLEDLIAAGSSSSEPLDQALANTGKWESEITLHQPNGNTVVAWVSVVLVEGEEAGDYIAIFNDITDWKATHQQLFHLAHYDPLTDLPNRTMFYEHLERALQRQERKDGFIAVLFIDLDGFKEINDNLGHRIGDRLLKEVGNVLQDRVRGADLLARVGGDEFVLLLEDLRQPGEAGAVADKLTHSLDDPLIIDGHHLRVQASIGVSFAPRDGKSADGLVSAADKAMYQAKTEEGERYRFASKPH